MGGGGGAPTDMGRSNTHTQNAGATSGGTRARTADKEEGHSKAGEEPEQREQGTRMEGMVERAHERQRQ